MSGCKRRGIILWVVLAGMLLMETACLCAEETTTVVVDSLGRTVVVPDRVDRIACMYAFSGHVVAMLGKADRIVAVSNGLKRDILLTEMFPAIRRAVVPKFQGTLNIEELTGANPDIVFVQSQTGRNTAMADKLTACGLKWMAVDFRNMDQQRDVISMIGKAVGATDKADAYNRYYTDCIERAQKGTSPIPVGNRCRVYHSTVDPNRTSAGNSLPTDWIHAAGLVNVTEQEPAGLLKGSDHVSIEQILLWNPDIILANEPGVAGFIRNSSQWRELAAVQKARVYQMPIGISRWGHPGSLETPLAILWTVKTVYPEKFPQLDIKAETRYFYEQFFHYRLSDKMVEQILSGKGMRLGKNGKRNRHGKE